MTTHPTPRSSKWRRMAWTLSFSLVRGIGYATGTGAATAAIWWLSHR